MPEKWTLLSLAVLQRLVVELIKKCSVCRVSTMLFFVEVGRADEITQTVTNNETIKMSLNELPFATSK
jgi:hypothetical protein